MSLAAGPGRGGGAEKQLPEELSLVVDKHVAYIQSLDTRRDELEYHLTEHLRVSGIYWGLTALHLLGHPDALPRNGVLDFVCSCLRENGGFGAAQGHDAHMLYTVSAVQVLALIDGFEDLERRVENGKMKIAKFISGLQQPNNPLRMRQKRPMIRLLQPTHLHLRPFLPQLPNHTLLHLFPDHPIPSGTY
ncbi:hypothetical protein KC329_g19164, partial [Hortaea werneckii]